MNKLNQFTHLCNGLGIEKQATLGDKIRGLTKKKAIKEPFDSETKAFLEKHYAPFQKELTKKYLTIE